jgi:hypothetical protein
MLSCQLSVGMLQKMEIGRETNVSMTSGHKVRAVSAPFFWVSKFVSNHWRVHSLDPISGHDVRIKVSENEGVVGTYFLNMTK